MIGPTPGDLPPMAPFVAVFARPPQAVSLPSTPTSTASTPAQSPAPASLMPGGMRRPRPLLQSDEVHTPFSTGMLGSFSPYRTLRVPETCYECNMSYDHFAHECPTRILRVRGSSPRAGARTARVSFATRPNGSARTSLTQPARSIGPSSRRIPSPATPLSLSNLTKSSAHTPSRRACQRGAFDERQQGSRRGGSTPGYRRVRSCSPGWRSGPTPRTGPTAHCAQIDE